MCVHCTEKMPVKKKKKTAAHDGKVLCLPVGDVAFGTFILVHNVTQRSK